MEKCRLKLSLGTRVEVTNLTDPGFRGSWYEGIIVHRSHQRRSYTVEYRNLVSDHDESLPLKEVVLASCVRPPPPSLPSDDFQVGDKVDAFHMDGWWVGQIVAFNKIPENDNDNDNDNNSNDDDDIEDHGDRDKFVVFFPESTEEIEFSRSQLRPHLDWDGNRWLRPTRPNQVESTLWPEKSKKESTQKTSSHIADPMVTTIDEHGEKQCQVINQFSGHAKRRVKLYARKSTNGVKKLRATTTDDVEVCKHMVEVLHKEVANGKDEQLSGKIQSSPVAEPICTRTTLATDLPAQESQNTLEMAPVCELKRTSSANQTKENGIISEEQNKSESHVDILEASSAGTPVRMEQLPQNSDSLFVRCSPIWETMQSIAVFNTMPQTPHFRPLEKCSEVLREGIAIGFMVSFADLAVTITKLKPENERCLFEKLLMAITELEEHGFNCQPLRACLEELLMLKDIFEQSTYKLADIGGQVVEKESQRNILNAEINTVNKEIAMLQEKAESLKKRKDECYVDIEQLQKEVEKLKHSSEQAKLEFQKVAAALL